MILKDLVSLLGLDSFFDRSDQKFLKEELCDSSIENLASRLNKKSDSSSYTEKSLMIELAHVLDLDYIDLDPNKIDYSLFDNFVSQPFALKNLILPVAAEDEFLLLACGKFNHGNLRSEIEQVLGRAVKFCLANPSEIKKWLNEFYYFRKNVSSASQDIKSSEDVFSFEQFSQLSEIGDNDADSSSVVKSVDYILRYAADQRATDIHLEPRKNVSLLRLRIDGVLHQAFELPRNVHNAFISRLKNLSRMDIAERRKPQDGRIKTEIGKDTIEFRASTLPLANGEKMVLRILNNDMLLKSFSDYGLSEGDQERIWDMTSQPNGLFLVTGPTGSGKSTTLYKALMKLADGTKNIITLEEPVEQIYDQFNQVSIQKKSNIDYPEAIRACLRQDPDVIMIGEIRDSQTASLALTASLTGHLVLSTLHTNSALGAVSRLRDLEQEPFLLADTLLGVMSQRLIRKICPKCKEARAISDHEALILSKLSCETTTLFEGKGCEFCRFTGFYGRIGIYEVHRFDDHIRSLIAKKASFEELSSYCFSLGPNAIAKDAALKVVAGLTSLGEVMSVLKGDAGFGSFLNETI